MLSKKEFFFTKIVFVYTFVWSQKHSKKEQKKHSSIVKYYYNFCIHSCDGKAEFSATITPVFSVTWLFWNHSNMLIWCSGNSIIIIIIIHFLGFCDEEKVQKNRNYFRNVL